MKHNSESSRQLKVANLIRQSLVDIFARGKKLDYRLIENKITITNVRVSPDLRYANCYFLPFGNKDKIKELEEALEVSRYAIRQQVTESVNLKFSPEIRFFYDTGTENAIEVEALLYKL